MEAHNHKFEIQLPDGWEDMTVHYFQGPEMFGVQHNLSLVVDPYCRTKDVGEYATMRVEAVMESIPDAEILKEEEISLPSGDAAYVVVYKWVPAKGKVLFQKLVYTIRDGKGYSFSATLTKATMKTIGVEVDRMIATFTPGPE